MSPTGPVFLDKKWIRANVALLRLRDWDLHCQVEKADILLERTKEAFCVSFNTICILLLYYYIIIRHEGNNNVR